MKSFSLKICPSGKILKNKFFYIYSTIFLLCFLFFALNFNLIKSYYYLNRSGLSLLKGNKELSLQYSDLAFDYGINSSGAYYNSYILLNEINTLQKAYELSQSNFFYLSRLACDSISQGKWLDSQKYFSGIKLARYLAREGASFVYDSDTDISKKGLFYLSFARKISTDPKVSYELGRALCWKYDSFTKGETLINEALMKDPKNPTFYRELGSICRRKKNYSKALSDFIVALRIDPNNYWTLIDISTILRDRGYLNEALKYLNRAKEIDPKIESAYYVSADIHKKLGNINLSYNEYQKIIELMPLSYSTRYNYGVFLYSAKDYDKAITQLTMSIILKDDYKWSYYYRSLAYEAISKLDLALADMKKVVSLDPENESFLKRFVKLESKVSEASNNKAKSH